MLARQEEADLSDRPSTGASNDPPEYTAHIRSRSTAHAHNPKRLSVFSSRSRSNTTTSTSSSSRRSPASSMTSADAASSPYSYEDRAGSSAGFRPDRHERHESVAKSLFSRGSRILRRQGSKLNIAATLDEEDEVAREKSRFEVSEIFSRHHKTRQSDAHEQLKSLISSPFDFHHLTHTSPSQFQALDKARENDIVTEFSAIRASQRPVTGLKGIRADDLHFRGFSEDLTNGGADTEHRTSPTATSPPSSPSASSSVSPKQHDRRARRESRVFENFSRPVSRYPRTGSTTPPPRTISPQLTSSPDLSEPAPRAIDEILGLSSQPTYPEHVYGNTDDVEHCSSLPQFRVEGIFSFQPEHAVNTDANTERIDADTSSVSLSSLKSVLEEVPEEQGITHWHDSPEASADTAMPASSSQIDPPADVPIPSVPRRKSQLSICVADELSKKFSEALGSPTLPQYRLFQDAGDQVVGGPIRRRSSARPRPAYETIYESWDADIDYCYEHAAESTFNFDWASNSLDEARAADRDDDHRAASGGAANEGNDGGLLHPIHLSTSCLPTPELDPSPARSLLSSQVAVTPSSAEYEGEIVSTGGDYFQPVNSSVFPSALGKQMTQDTLYEEYLEADAESDRHFPFCAQGLIHAMDHPVSPRSSFSPISKCNSQESLILSRAASIVRKHRSSVSTGSVPELVHSLASSRELPPMESLPTTEQSGYTAPSLTGRTEVPSLHRQTKSLAREIERQIMSRAENNSSPAAADQAPTSGPVHDRSKSTSEVEGPRSARTIKSNTSAPLPPIPMKSPNRRKGRTSYSLFPTPAAN
ncbi:hypothetical protein CNMCM5793_001087 [Aspergillus hiratsukae]|uniref:CRIB domain-containing protein n=1 Tax=Aspergillus hiratsukae TaxID=1194566 RepID=A0A8H6Q0B7_9EURO|nr:hypothetical protein CNMCM5793_001087 [Aspergillus hiratsukae]KAF7164580.1 hypothetical protein CNMCM6106_001067 [Aspergillus hiratsukae]